MENTQEFDQKTADMMIKKMVVDNVVGFDMVKLKNGHYAAFWCGGYETSYTIAIAKGDYSTPPFAHIGDVVSTSHFLKSALDDIKKSDPHNFGNESLNIKGVIAKTLRIHPLNIYKN